MWVIDSGIFGHFLRAGSDDLIVRINGCEPHAGNSDGNMIFTRTGRVWTVGRQYRRGALGECRRIANRRGQDGLLCLTYAIFHGEVKGWFWFGYETTDDDRDLLVVFDNTSSDKAKESRVPCEMQKRRTEPGLLRASLPQVPYRLSLRWTDFLARAIQQETQTRLRGLRERSRSLTAASDFRLPTPSPI